MGMPSIEEMRQIVLEFCRPPRVSQMVTIDRNGLPTGRTLGATLNPDYTVDIITIATLGFKRIEQVQRNPGVLFIWWEREASPGPVPRVVFAKCLGEVLTGEPVLAWYDRAVAAGRTFEGVTREQAAERWALIHCQVKQFRAEGFTRPGEALAREEIRYGLTWKV
ncbi:MAG: hypothetical protein KatS3mg061_2811 [Dehalococcoidia bacterium]|nr:MAG: hypothetical protein KatS3mg061_2811 [Dehalococcoidia bacterium]